MAAMASPLDNSGFSDALVILGAAGIVIPAFARFRISPVIGFILVGLLVGPSGLGNWVQEYPWLYYLTISDAHSIEPFAEFGIILLLFSIGLELSLKRLWSMRSLVFGTGAAQLLASGMLIGIGLYVAGQASTGAAALGIALALSSTALVLPIAGTSSVVGRTAFAMLLFEDLALVPIIFVLGALAPSASGDGLTNIIGVLGRGAITVAVIFLAGRMLLPKLFAQAARTKSPELFLAASLLVVIAASLATTAAGLSPIVGALLAGLLIAETDYHSEVEVITAPFKGLALGVFLITVGMSLNVELIADNWASLLLAIVGVVAVKTAVTFGLLKLARIRNGVAAEVGVMMASPSETTLIVLGTAAQAQLIQPSTANFWQTVTAIGLTITPLLAQLGKRAAKRIEKRSSGDGSELEIPPEGPGTVVIGFGRVGRMVADMLKVHNPAVRRGRGGYRRGRRGADRRLSGDLRRRRAQRTGRPAQSRPGQGVDPDDGRPGPVGPPHPARPRLGARSDDRRPRPRHCPCRATVQGRRDRRGSRNAGKLAAIVRGGAGRSRRRGRPGDRVDPRKARRTAQGNPRGRRNGPRPAAEAPAPPDAGAEHAGRERRLTRFAAGARTCLTSH